METSGGINNENGINVVSIRLVNERKAFNNTPIRTKSDAIKAMCNELSLYDREIFCILNLRTDGSVINMNIVSQGTLNASLVSPREVFKSSILSNTASFIALHNHPSGNIKPSKQDYDITKRLYECGELLDIYLLDHIIVGGGINKCYSFREHNELGYSYEEIKNRNCHER